MPNVLQMILLALGIFTGLSAHSQTVVNGWVKDKTASPIFAANVYFKSDPQKGATTDFEGKFSIAVTSLYDTLIITAMGYQSKEIIGSKMNQEYPLNIVLEEKVSRLKEVIVKYTEPISEQFSVVKVDMLKDVYLNPVAQGDPLKALHIMPFSTNTDETANPSFRGSQADRTRIIFNGIPMMNPVRAANLSNQGFFSLLNPEVIGKQNVYAGNPPLTFGNTSAGLVEVETKRKLRANQLKISTHLAGGGLLWSQKISNDDSFIQAYTNYQFSDAYVNIQPTYLPNIQNFSTKDAGLNVHLKASEAVEFNAFNYLIDEGFQGKNIESYTYKGNTSTERLRFLTINNFKVYRKKGTWQLNFGASTDNNSYQYGNKYRHKICSPVPLYKL